jgi:hypothetical protein
VSELILAALYALSIRPPRDELDLGDLKHRLTAIRCALGLGSAILVLAVLSSRTLLGWPLQLLTEPYRKALLPIADALTMQLGATSTIALVAAFAPAIIAWQLDVAAYNERPAKQEGDAAMAMDANLVFAPMSLITSIVAVLAPLLASPFVNALQSILGAIGGKLG